MSFSQFSEAPNGAAAAQGSWATSPASTAYAYIRREASRVEVSGGGSLSLSSSGARIRGGWWRVRRILRRIRVREGSDVLSGAGEVSFDFFRGQEAQPFAHIEVVAARWIDGWLADGGQTWQFRGALVAPKRLAAYLARHGLPELADQLRRARVEAQKTRRWTQAVPRPLRTLWGEHAERLAGWVTAGGVAEAGLPDPAPFHAALRAAVPDPLERARILLRWNGAGDGTWFQHRVREAFPFLLLRDVPASDILTVLERTQPWSDPQLIEGAARYVACPFFTEQQSPRSIRPAMLRTLFERSTSWEDGQSRQMARDALGPAEAPSVQPATESAAAPPAPSAELSPIQQNVVLAIFVLLFVASMLYTCHDYVERRALPTPRPKLPIDWGNDSPRK